MVLHLEIPEILTQHIEAEDVEALDRGVEDVEDLVVHQEESQVTVEVDLLLQLRMKVVGYPEGHLWNMILEGSHHLQEGILGLLLTLQTILEMEERFPWSHHQSRNFDWPHPTSPPKSALFIDQSFFFFFLFCVSRYKMAILCKIVLKC